MPQMQLPLERGQELERVWGREQEQERQRKTRQWICRLALAVIRCVPCCCPCLTGGSSSWCWPLKVALRSSFIAPADVLF